MVVSINCEGFDCFKKCVKENDGKTIFALFCGSPKENGESWCPDCVVAEPVVKRNLSHIPDDAVFIHCNVGSRDFWKDQENVFRKDPTLELKSVPTLLKLGAPQRLEEEKCANDDLVKMLFSDD